MRIDKLTTKFQEALADAQSLALGKDHAYIDPAHVLMTMLQQPNQTILIFHLNNLVMKYNYIILHRIF